MTTGASDLDKHTIPGFAQVLEGQGGLPMVRVTTPAATGEIYLHGGQVTSWTPTGHRDVLFVSPASRWEAGRAIRGGIPVCFPWFGNKVGDEQAPAHGLVRTRAWTLDSIRRHIDTAVIDLGTASDEADRPTWRLELRAIVGASLKVELTVTNTGIEPLVFEEALHAYYAVGDAARARVSGLDEVRFLDKVDGGRERVQEGDVTIVAETDRVYLDTTGPLVVEDPVWRRRIQIERAHSRAAVVWNPWIERARALADLQDDDWTRFVCVEAANVRPLAIDLGPGERHALSMTVTLSDV
jgi:glucose-6-phosphate 1-epimerase